MIITDVHLGDQQVDHSDVNILVCDIDGTVADLTHRRRFVASQPKNWKAFEAVMHLDTPISEIIDVVDHFFWNNTKVIMCSGRGSQNRKVTKEWLWENGVLYHELYMRDEGDYRKDSIVKKELLGQIRKDHGEPDLVLDDRNQVVEMWRAEGLRCIQVAEGDF